MASIRTVKFSDDVEFKWNTGKLNKLVCSEEAILDVFKKYIETPFKEQFKYDNEFTIRDNIRNDILSTLKEIIKEEDPNLLVNFIVALRLTSFDPNIRTKVYFDAFNRLCCAIEGGGGTYIQPLFLELADEKGIDKIFWNICYDLNHSWKKFIDEDVYVLLKNSPWGMYTYINGLNPAVVNDVKGLDKLDSTYKRNSEEAKKIRKIVRNKEKEKENGN